MEQRKYSLEQCKVSLISADDNISQFHVISRISQILSSGPLSFQLKNIFGNFEISIFNKFLSDSLGEIAVPVARSTVLDILSHIYIFTDLSNDMTFCFIKPLHSILKENIFEAENEVLLFKTVHLLSVIVNYEKCSYEMLEDGYFSTLCKLYCQQLCGKEQYLTILQKLLTFHKVESVDANQEAFDLLLANMSEQFVSEHSLRKFTLCSQIHDVLLQCENFDLKPESTSKIVQSLTVLFRNRLPNEHRENAIKLASLLVKKQNILLFSDDTEISKVFFTALVQLSCVEIAMLLEDKSISEVNEDVELLSICYIILEYAISTMTADGWFEANRDCCQQLLNSIKMAMGVILLFLKKLESDLSDIEFYIYDNSNRPEIHPDIEILIATVRVVCCWLTEETFNLQDEVREVLPFILKVCKEWFRNFEGKKLQLPSDIDLVRFLMPPLCHLTADKKSREILLINGLLPLLLKYFNAVWEQFKMDEDNISPEILITLCRVFLNIIVLEPHLVTDNDQIPFFCKIVLADLPSLSTDVDFLALRAYFVVLGLLITKHCHKKVIDREMCFYPFLIASIKFLWDAHYVESQDMTLCLTRKYKDEWDNIMELWFLGMESLSTLLPVMPWIANFIVESSWPSVILDMFLNVSADGIESNVKATYQALLTALIKSTDNIVDIIVQRNGIFLSQKHDLTELEELLSNHMLTNTKFKLHSVQTKI